MGLEEILRTLPQGHKARIEFCELTARLSKEKDKVFDLKQQAKMTFDENAKFQIVGDQLVVSIGFEGLKRSIELDADLIVTDGGQAAVAIKHAISFEEEDGRTPFHQMLVEAAYTALANGEMGLEEPEI